MKSINHRNMRRVAASLVAGLTLVGMLALSARADMYQVGTPVAGGVPAQSTITSVDTVSNDTTVCWYGMQGWYKVEMSTDLGITWTNVGLTAASDFAWCLTVDNGGNTGASFRLNQTNSYASSGACAGCHGDKYGEWNGTEHAHALSVLQNIGQGANASCIPCHTVGFGQPTGYVDQLSTPQLANVGCENCHGPAGWHKYSDHDLIHPAVSIDPAICGGCHTGSHHPTYDEYETSPHAHANDHVAPGGAMSEKNMTSCGVCHSAVARLAMLNDYEARLEGHTNKMELPSQTDAGLYTAACATCHDPHSYENTAQLRNPTRSTNYYTMPSLSDSRKEYTTNFMGVVTTNTVYYNTTFATMYDPNVNVCGQCHNSRGGRWDGRTYGVLNVTNVSGPVTNTVYVDIYTNIITTNIIGSITTYTTNSYIIGRSNYTEVVASVTNVTATVGLTDSISHSRPPHHSPQYNLLIGNIQDGYLPIIEARHGTGVSSSSGSYNTNQCATCHVPSYAVNSGTNVTGHTFEMQTNNCTLCHGSVPNYVSFQTGISNTLNTVVGLLNEWATNKAEAIIGSVDYAKSLENSWEYTTIGELATITNAGPSSSKQLLLPDAILQARFNAYMVLHDGSYGVHNPNYAEYLLEDAEHKIQGQLDPAYFAGDVTSGFSPLTVNFSSYGSGITAYSWDFGDGNTSTEANPSHVYTNPSATDPVTNTVTLTVTTGSGDVTLTRTDYIIVHPVPQVAFSATPTEGAAPLLVTFTNLTPDLPAVTQWRWTFGDGSATSSSKNPTHTYTTPGVYDVYLRATTAGGRTTVTNAAFITVTNAP